MVMGKLREMGRRGTVAVETALVMLVVAMLLFAIFEYGRLLMDWNVLNNAAREGCRYALVNNTDSAIDSKVEAVVKAAMGGQDKSFNNFTVTVSGTHLGVSTLVNNLVPGDQITVTVSGNYKFLNIVPFAPMPSSFTISSSVTMVCEGGT
jgi:Flp pilus assembly protein TadG